VHPEESAEFPRLVPVIVFEHKLQFDSRFLEVQGEGEILSVRACSMQDGASKKDTHLDCRQAVGT